MKSREELIKDYKQWVFLGPITTEKLDGAFFIDRLISDFVLPKVKETVKEDREKTIEVIANAVITYRGMIKEAKTKKDKFSCRGFILALTDIVKELQELWREEYD